MTPQRVQRSRARGWRMPSNTVYVGRPSVWGNPFVVDTDWIVWAAVALGFLGNREGRRAAAVELYRSWMTQTVPVLKRARSGGAIGYADGSVIDTAQHVQGLAGTVAGVMGAPTLPERPSLDALRGKHLACWCPIVGRDGNRVHCHADVLLELANQ